MASRLNKEKYARVTVILQTAMMRHRLVGFREWAKRVEATALYPATVTIAGSLRFASRRRRRMAGRMAATQRLSRSLGFSF